MDCRRSEFELSLKWLLVSFFPPESPGLDSREPENRDGHSQQTKVEGNFLYWGWGGEGGGGSAKPYTSERPAGDRTKVTTPITVIQHQTGSPSHPTRKINKRYAGKEEIKQFPFADNITTQGIHKNLFKKKPQLISEFSKIENNQIILYTNN